MQQALDEKILTERRCTVAECVSIDCKFSPMIINYVVVNNYYYKDADDSFMLISYFNSNHVINNLISYILVIHWCHVDESRIVCKNI